MEQEVMTTFGTTLGTIITWLLGKKYLIPQLIQLWNWIRHKETETAQNSINAVQELLEIKEKDADVYEGQIQFLNEQIKNLQEHLTIKEAELDKHYSLQDSLKEELIELSKKVYLNERRIAILQDLVCYRYDCKLRLAVKDKQECE